MDKKSNKNREFTPEEFAFLVGGKVAKGDETGAERLAKKGLGTPFPMLKTKEERQRFYMDYIPALYWVEIEGKDPDELNREDLDFFWYAFTLGIKGLEPVKLNDEKEGDDMDG